jgi:hypothetical protein
MKTKRLPRSLLLISVMLFVTLFQAVPDRSVMASSSQPTPVLAYYYIWFDSKSWDRAKTDYPLLGNYSSDDKSVMQQHIRWAKDAGINGFIVSWKSTDILNRRLSLLAEVAAEENFKLAVIYQGLDFDRNPLPIDRISSDLNYFTDYFASKPVFQIFNKPMIIWSGTWKYSAEDIEKVISTHRVKLMILGSEKNVDGYERIAKSVEGNAYYWSSVNPDTFQGYSDKLIEMSKAIHANHGIWVAPAAPGFDAHVLGGTSLVDRKDGETLRTQINTAQLSSPDVLGLISWNEFSENSQIEPSVNYKKRSLEVLSEINHMPVPAIADFDSSEPTGVYKDWFTGSRFFALGGLAILMLSGILVLAFRHSMAVPIK